LTVPIELIIGGAISFLNFGIHAVMTALIVVTTRRTKRRIDHHGVFVRLTALLTVTVTILMCAHVVEIAVWAAFMDLLGIKIAKVGSFEFAFENYTALGYGDALPANTAYRLIGPVIALNGLLLIGWSVAVIFEVMRMAEFQVGRRTQRTD
jgi:predicted transporter